MNIMTENQIDSYEATDQTIKRDALDELLSSRASLYRRQKIIFVLTIIAFIVVIIHIILDVFLQNPNLP